jgi:hypothetical protein
MVSPVRAFSASPVLMVAVISNLRLEHAPTKTPPTIDVCSDYSHFADNSRSVLEVRDHIVTCHLRYQHRAINSSNQSLQKYDSTVRECTITGLDHPNPSLAPYAPGNYIGVKLGAMGPGRPAIDMGDSYFEVRRCKIDSAKWAAVAGAFFESNKQSEFVVTDNIIGCHPNSPLETTRVGIIFLNAAVMNPTLESWPKGRITLTGNNIKLEGYFTFPWPEWATGILVNVNSDLPEHVKKYQITTR